MSLVARQSMRLLLIALVLALVVLSPSSTPVAEARSPEIRAFWYWDGSGRVYVKGFDFTPHNTVYVYVYDASTLPGPRGYVTTADAGGYIAYVTPDAYCPANGLEIQAYDKASGVWSNKIWLATNCPW